MRAGGGEQIHAPVGEGGGFGLRGRAAVAADNAVFAPAGERSEQLTVSDGGGG